MLTQAIFSVRLFALQCKRGGSPLCFISAMIDCLAVGAFKADAEAQAAATLA